jgi:hypothetical protein
LYSCFFSTTLACVDGIIAKECVKDEAVVVTAADATTPTPQKPAQKTASEQTFAAVAFEQECEALYLGQCKSNLSQFITHCQMIYQLFVYSTSHSPIDSMGISTSTPSPSQLTTQEVCAQLTLCYQQMTNQSNQQSSSLPPLSFTEGISQVYRMMETSPVFMNRNMAALVALLGVYYVNHFSTQTTTEETLHEFIHQVATVERNLSSSSFSELQLTSVHMIFASYAHLVDTNTNPLPKPTLSKERIKND